MLTAVDELVVLEAVEVSKMMRDLEVVDRT